jgi:hypothetical protein
MPTWEFFAFKSNEVAKALLLPTQNAIRNGDLAAWQKVYDKLNSYHYPPHVNGFSWGGTIVENYANRPDAISRDAVPDEGSFALRKQLQTFVELVSRHHLESWSTRPRTWVTSLVDWKILLKSPEEFEQIQAFQSEIIGRQTQPPDPFCCLASNDATDANYVPPETVASFAELEAKTGLLRSLPTRNTNDELPGLMRDLAAAGLLIELAANAKLALYFREDGT